MITHHAILVGIDGVELKGAINDVQEMKKMLEKTHNRRNMDIKTFTAALSDKPGAALSPQDSSQLPTFDNIVKAFGDIVSRAEPGHYLYFHFSGHGTTTPFQPTNNEQTENLLHIADSEDYKLETSTDVALQVLTKQSEFGTPYRYLRGLELAGLLKRAADKGMMLTVVLDCCYSGSVVRNNRSIRFVPYDPEIDARYPLDPELALGVDQGTGNPNFRGASMVAWLLNPKEYSILTACDPFQSSRELKIGNTHHGALSYHLVRVFTKLGRVGGRQAHIYAHVCARFREGKSEQKPMLYGNKRLGFFESFNSPFYANPIPVLHYQGKYQLEAGQAHGICVGDRFALVTLKEYSNPCNIQPREEAFEVATLGPTMSELKTVGGISVSTASSKTVTACTNLSLRRFPIHMRLDCVNDEIWRSQLQNRPSLNITIGDAEPEADFSFYLTIRDNNLYVVKDMSKVLLSDMPLASLDAEEGVSLVLDVMEHLARFQMIRSLFNDSPDQSFLDSFEVEMKDEANTKRFHPGCLLGDQLCSHSDCLGKVRHNQRVYLTVRNKARSPDRPIYFHIFDMDSSWGVETIACRNNKVGGTNASYTQRIRLTVPDIQRRRGETECEDIIKVFITTNPISFMSLELSEIGALYGKTARGVKRGGVLPPTRDDWAAFNFRFQTYID